MRSVAGQRLIRLVNREQMCWRAVDVERLIGDDHPARAIWDFVGRLDLRSYYERVAANEEMGGRPAFDPRLLVSLWVYGYSLGIGSAREIARRCEWESGFQWLTGCEVVTEEAKAQYRKRSRVAEFCHAWIKTKFGLRQLHVRGLIKAKTEMLWAALTFNIQLAIRLA